MIDLIIDSIMSVKHSINSNNVTPCFELFGKKSELPKKK